MQRVDSRLSGPPSPAHRRNRADSRAAFTLTEILIATTILGMAVGMTMVVFIAAMKRAQHTETALKGTAELRLASDMIAQAVRTAPRPATINNNGLQLFVPPKDEGFLIVNDITWLDAAKTTKGTKANMRNMQVDPAGPAAPNWVFAGTARPTTGVAAGDMGTYFRSAAPAVRISDIVSVNDVVSIPLTSFGNATEATINSVSKNAGTATITFASNVGEDVPSGTKLRIKVGRTMLFEVVSDKTKPIGDLRYYPDSRDLTKFTVLAHNIDLTPLSDPADATSARTVPFLTPAGEADRVVINLQKMPPGTAVGRTVQGVRTTVFTRTDPSIP